LFTKEKNLHHGFNIKGILAYFYEEFGDSHDPNNPTKELQR
jgi:hypothetical protein